MWKSPDLFDRYLEAWNEGDPGVIAGMFTDAAKYKDPSVDRPLEGRDEIREHAEKVLRNWPEQHWIRLRHWDHASGGTVLWRATITSPRSGRDVTFDGLDLFEIAEDGLIAELLVHFDPAKWRGLAPRRILPPEDRVDLRRPQPRSSIAT